MNVDEKINVMRLKDKSVIDFYRKWERKIMTEKI